MAINLRKPIRLCVRLLFVVALSAQESRAQDAGTTAADFLLIYADARPSALGGAYTALADNAAGLAFNPAGLARPDFKEITLSYVDWFDNASFHHIAVTYPLGGGQDAFGLSLLQFNAGDFRLTDELGVPTNETLEARDYAATFGYARRIRRDLSVGLGLKYIHRQLDFSIAQAAAIDLGVHYAPFENGLTMGATLQNLGQDIKFVQASEPLPQTFRAGVSSPILLERIVLVADLVKVQGDAMQYAAGVEVKALESVMLRAGWREEEGSLIEGSSVGFGLRFKSILFDYSYVPYEIFGATHRVTGTFRFGEPTQPQVRNVPRESPFPDRRVRSEERPASESGSEASGVRRAPQPIRRGIERPPVRIRGAESR